MKALQIAAEHQITHVVRWALVGPRRFRNSPAQIAVSQDERNTEFEPGPYPAYLEAGPIKVPASIEEAATLPVPDLADAFFYGVMQPATSTSLVVEVPTLVIWGMLDPSQLPGLLNGLDAYVPDLTLLRIEDAGHYPMQTHPEQVTRAIKQFLSKR